MPMRRPTGSLAATVALAAAGCGGADGEALPPACQEGPDAVVSALRAAPQPVLLADGTALSACVSAAAGSDADLQAVGLTLSSAAERLVAEGDAVALGYLVGAARRGSEATAGIALELVRRLESSARQVTGADRAALREGLRAGEASG